MIEASVSHRQPAAGIKLYPVSEDAHFNKNWCALMTFQGGYKRILYGQSHMAYWVFN